MVWHVSVDTCHVFHYETLCMSAGVLCIYLAHQPRNHHHHHTTAVLATDSCQSHTAYVLVPQAVPFDGTFSACQTCLVSVTP